MKLSKNFDSSEFDCRCCGAGGCAMHPQLISGLEILRLRLVQPIMVISGFRCKEHNQIVGGSDNSRHLFAEAADIRSSIDRTPGALAILAEAAKGIPHFKSGGIGVYNNFIHVDVRWVAGMPGARW